ncbi:MAG: glucose-1-phosphate cytidylyltransferase [Bacteroidetes bacterium RIFOXYA12_FULL_35_11]|nr:MAG: glucose-1-phosphate cytidylyltransferase [Bacteroidetes bacterium GWF2_35_48]OFY73070.1 MAG: glucose-1-phosphate cytidylyltransferase [Bacteroidetes bacterium RIFOXYA12_FULL_35_11]OFY94628.1 MAG: glucose-1-phosphate cytidylyltransferase [Bacteroidetes bacterium RIFOXYC12_FULL_35_7]HBX53532.1 glucose-1-phosphate cytidylyltransferase [Bacteroidales bacterium]
MKLIILAGGFGSRLGSLTNSIPKPMIPVGGKPIMWHIMKIYAHYGIKDFIICLGYMGDVIKDYFLHYESKNRDFTINLQNNSIVFHNELLDNDWKITLVDTGLNTLKGGRLKRIEKYLTDDINLLTYGDGVANIDIRSLIDFHKKKGKIVTISGVHPPARFGELIADGDIISSFQEKSQTSQGMINGGYMVFNKELLTYLSQDESCDLEAGVLENLAKQEEIAVYKHDGFWACMDHERDLVYLEKLWNNNNAFWKVWK